MKEKLGGSVSCNSVSWNTAWYGTLIYKNVVEVSRACLIKIKFEEGETAKRNYLRDILTDILLHSAP